MIDYNIIATGSKGNAVVIDQKILIDCGVSFKALSKVYRALKLVLLTHIHGDHFQPTTLRLLAEKRPTVKGGAQEKTGAACGENSCRYTEKEDRRLPVLLIPVG